MLNTFRATGLAFGIALEDVVLLRLATMVDEHAEIAEVDMNR